MSRSPMFAANWKMNLLRADVESFFDALEAELPTVGPDLPERPYDLLISPSACWLTTACERSKVLGIHLAAQDVHHSDFGAHTGDLSAHQAHDAGANFTLVGHSERRTDHHEDDDLVLQKAVRAQTEASLGVVLCFGEALEDREANHVEDVLTRQLAPLFRALEQGTMAADPRLLVLAYEPVWAIGTGRTATPELAQETHETIRRMVAEQVGPNFAEQVKILYGGSVKPANAADLLAQPDIDGFLIGGASLDSRSFLDIIRCCGF